MQTRFCRALGLVRLSDLAQHANERIDPALVLNAVRFKGGFAVLMEFEQPFDHHLRQIIERLGIALHEQTQGQGVSLAGLHGLHARGVQRLGFSSKALAFHIRNASECSR